METRIIVSEQEADRMITRTPPLFRIRRSDGKWFAGHDARGHALFRRDVAQASVMLEAFAERQRGMLENYAHAVELVEAD